MQLLHQNFTSTEALYYIMVIESPLTISKGEYPNGLNIATSHVCTIVHTDTISMSSYIFVMYSFIHSSVKLG